MELAALLELLYSARDRSRTVRCTVRRSSDEARMLAVLRERGLYQEPPRIPPEEGEWGRPPERMAFTTHLWAAQPDLLRWETEGEADGVPVGRSVGVKRGERFWTAGLGEGVQSNEGRAGGGTMWTTEERLVDPSPLLGDYRFELTGETAALGRPALRVRARVRPGRHQHDFGAFVDELALVVDAERGLLLSVSAFVGGSEVARLEVVELALDEPLAETLFEPLREGS